MRRERRRSRRGSVLLAVMVVVGIAALIAASLMLRVEGERATAAVSLRRTRTRALAWSGVQAVMAELSGKRDELLDGGAPTVTATWELFSEGGARGVVRLVPIGEKGETLVAESAKLDVNHATKEMLARAESVGEGGAAKIVETRRDGFSSVEALAGLLGDAGPVKDREDSAAGWAGEAPRAAWRDELTTFAFDPNVQCGVKGNEEGRGKLRIDLSPGWTPELRRAIAERLSEEAAQIAEGKLKDHPALKSDGELTAMLLSAGIDAKQWGVFLDAFTTGDDEYRAGRVDLNRAEAAVLACVPGIDAATAGKIVSVRESLSADVKRDVTWPLTEGLMKQENYQKSVDWLCTRSMQWRVRVEAGIVKGEEKAGSKVLGGGVSVALPTDGDSEESKMEHKVVLEAVIDVAGRRPRIAYLRDVTYLEAAKQLAARHEAAAAPDAGARQEADRPPAASEGDGGVKAGSGREGAMAPASRARAEREAMPESRVPMPGSEKGGAAPGEGRSAAPEPAPSGASKPRDRRIGRWTAGGGKG